MTSESTSTFHDQKAAFFDVDGTLTSKRVWNGMLDYFKEHKLRRKTHYLYISLNFPSYILRKMGLISEASFRRPWAAHLSWYLRGYTLEECDQIWDWIIYTFLMNAWREDSVDILKSHLNNGDIVVLVSSGPTPLIKRIAQSLGTPHAVGTKLEIRNGKYTGKSLEPVCIASYKASLAKDYLISIGQDVNFEESYTYADSTSDLALLEMVGHPVAVYPDIGLRRVAAKRNWNIFPQ
jgi:HAD superfamily hydrolase (TIGR01490 family)